MKISRSVMLSGVMTLVLICALGPASRPVETQARATHDFAIRTLSSRPDLISGGDVLVQVTLPSAAANDTSISLNGHDVTSVFRASQESAALVGLVSGLPLGKNKLELAAKGKSLAKLTLVNHPSRGR